MWQLSEAIDGMSDACRAFGLPVVGGNVSLYNESRDRNIDPTPVIGLLGMVDQLDRPPPGVGLQDGGRLIAIGPEASGLAGSAFAARHGGARQGVLAPLDMELHSRVAGVVRELVGDHLVQGAHDVASGGLGGALTEMAVQSGVGVTVARVADHRALFAESPSRVVVCVAPEDMRTVLDRCGLADVSTTQLGMATGDRIVVKGLVDVALDEVRAAVADRLKDALGHGTVQGPA
jgi:phosphoribosylformylglycinamidine synthase